MMVFNEPRALGDGAMGTQIAARGAQGGIPEAFNESDPDLIRGIHSDYLKAGAMIISANTFGAHPAKLARIGMREAAERLAAAGVRLARKAADDSGKRVWVALDVGPTGELLSPLGGLDFDAAAEGYARIGKAAVDAGADLAILETFSDIGEARAAMIGMAAANLPAIASFTFEGARMLMGGTPRTAAMSACALGAFSVGVNCSQGPEAMAGILEDMGAVAPLPLWVKPNAGIPRIVGGATVFPYSPDDMAPAMKRLLDKAWGIGGCCGTSPEHIAAFAPLLEGLERPASRFDGVERVCSQRIDMPVSEAMEIALEVPADLDELLEAEAEAFRVDLGALAPPEIADFLREAQQMVSAPLIFLAHSDEQRDAAVRYYHGKTHIKRA